MFRKKEVAKLRREEFKKRAMEMVDIPTHFQPVIEEYTDGEVAMFVWENDEKDEEVSIELDGTGNLIRLSIDSDAENSAEDSLSKLEKRERAEQFLVSHYPDALKELIFTKAESFSRTVRFYYEQLVMDLPLEYTGCYIDIDPTGKSSGFKYYGKKQVPSIPTALISKEKLGRHVSDRLDFQLTIANLLSAIHDVAEDGLRLVYEPKQFFMNYKAAILEPTLSIIHDEDDPETYISLSPTSSKVLRKELTNEEIIGITERMEVIREVDMQNETGIVWRDRDWEMKEQDLSINGFFIRHTEDTVKAFISKETGIVKSFMWFNERQGELRLSREECFQRCIEFLQQVVPDYYDYMQLIVREVEVEEDEENPPSNRETFTISMHNGQGVHIESSRFMVSVSRSTGLIDHYHGPDFDLEQLHRIPSEPVIPKIKARELFLSQLDFELAWKPDYDSESESYILVYQACHRNSKKEIRYIDAITGELILAK